MRIRVIVAGLLQAGLAACGAETPSGLQTQEHAPRSAAESAAADESRRSVPGLGARDRAGAPNDAAAAAELSFSGPSSDPLARMIIRTGNASLEVDSLETGLAELRRLAGRLGGYVANASFQGGRDRFRTATLEVKVPSERFDDLTSGLDPLGRVEFVNVSAEDVGEEYVDLTARAANAGRLESRLLDLLASRTGKLQDVLSVERELARVREEIERIEGRLRYLKTRAALSTLSVTMHEPPPIVAHGSRHPLAEAFRQAWRNFMTILAGSIASLGYLVPVATVVWAAILLGKRFRRQPA